MIQGIGTDIVSLHRFEQLILKRSPNHIKNFSARFLNSKREHTKFLTILKKYNDLKNNDKIITAAEAQQKQQEQALKDAALVLATTWCVKEALYKSLSIEQQRHFIFKDWFKFNDEHGRPNIGVDKTSIISQEKAFLFSKDSFLLSLSHDGDYMTSTVLRQLNIS